MAFATDLLRLRSHLPPAAWPAVLAWLQVHPVLVRVSTSRRTKLGDYRTADRTRPHRISVNEDLNPYAFLVVSFNLLFRPSVTPAEIVPFALNQFRIRPSWLRSRRATFFIGSIFDRIVRVHHSCKNRFAQPAYW